MKKIIDKKVTIIFMTSTVFILLIVSILFYFLFIRDKFVFKLIGNSTITVGIYDTYNELGVKAFINKEDWWKSMIECLKNRNE